MVQRSLKRLLLGRPLRNQELSHEKLSNWKALPIFSSDALSSIAYGPEQVILALTAASALAYGFVPYVSVGILFLLAVVTLSYVQVARANPGGGGSYSVAKGNLGELPALIAAGSLIADYCLTVAVSISSGTDALVSAFPQLNPIRLGIDLFVLFGILMIINLRGVRESANAFVYPTYAFIFGIAALIVTGMVQAFTGTQPVMPPGSLEKQWTAGMLFVLLRAFSNGCSSMTGIEAISNGVPNFKEPAAENARITTYWMSAILGTMFAGISFLMMHYHILPIENVTGLSQIAELTVGRNWAYYYIQFTTMLILYLAANTAYNGLPPLLSLLAIDGYMPRYLSARGDRLAFTNGIIFLTLAAAALIVVYHGDTEHLISLYAIGVFLSFTIAQSGMVIHWRKVQSPGWRSRATINGMGAIITGVVVVVIAVTKFRHGAWMILVFIPAAIYVFKKIKTHYSSVSEQLGMDWTKIGVPGLERKHIVIVPIAGVNRVVQNTIEYAKILKAEVHAVFIGTDSEQAVKVLERWNRWQPGIELRVIESPYRTIITPLVRYIDRMDKKNNPQDFITILIPEFETKKWWHRILHNQTGWMLRTVLLLYRDVVVTTVPFKLTK
ncbi:amino acid permease [Heliobacterium gestii]|uniref:Amino acid permease n=1 Tax=Heliomicrobium gestii TaxID=2699 RepID=A0A845LFU4_HELGE|nr:APC family permease [Heliomicrobium gestii]MBM7866940.1 amino acid transporter [Heliomicrobium gestii]MZP42363.1 amino acid permease [Heliomicrobium gestii]